MASYATFEQLQALYGEGRLLASTPLATGTTLQARWELYLAGASGQIDEALLRQGYVLPLVLTGQDNAASALSEACIALALEKGAPGMIATPEGVKTAADLARERLDQWASGTRRLPFVISQQIFAAVPRPELTGSDPWVPFDDRLFYLLRFA